MSEFYNSFSLRFVRTVNFSVNYPKCLGLRILKTKYKIIRTKTTDNLTEHQTSESVFTDTSLRKLSDFLSFIQIEEIDGDDKTHKRNNQRHNDQKYGKIVVLEEIGIKIDSFYFGV